MSTGDPFWADKIAVLFRADRAVEFFPTKDMTDDEKLNSLVRFSVYLGILLSLFKRKLEYFAIPALTAAFTLFVKEYRNCQQKAKKSPDTKKCTRPTKNNPCMNVLPFDDPKRPDACDVNDPEIAKEMKKYLDEGVYKSVGDAYDSQINDRPFYTLPASTIPPDNEDFIKWTTSTGANCKADGQCELFDDLRRESSILAYESNLDVYT